MLTKEGLDKELDKCYGILKDEDTTVDEAYLAIIQFADTYHQVKQQDSNVTDDFREEYEIKVEKHIKAEAERRASWSAQMKEHKREWLKNR